MARTNKDSVEQTMTKEEFHDLLSTNINAWLTVFLEEFGLNIYNAGEYQEMDEDDMVHGLGIECVETEGGYEGGGEYADAVFAVINEEGIPLTYFRITGSYNSYDGTEWSDTVKEVVPREVTITQYFDKEV